MANTEKLNLELEELQDIADVEVLNQNFQKIDNFAKEVGQYPTFNTLQEALDSENLQLGNVVTTLGLVTLNDGGGREYIIQSTKIGNGVIYKSGMWFNPYKNATTGNYQGSMEDLNNKINTLATTGGITPIEAQLEETTNKGMPNGYAPLNASGLIDAEFLPSYVDDIIEGFYYELQFYKEISYENLIIPETDKIYIDITNDGTNQYRWSGSSYIFTGTGQLATETTNGLMSFEDKMSIIDLKNKVQDYTYDTIALAKADLSLKNGNLIKVVGYHEKGDGCNGLLKIMPSGSFGNPKHEGGLWFTLNNGLTATWILEQSNHISIRQLGGKDDGVFDNTPVFLRARQLEGWVIDFPYITIGKYFINGDRPVDGTKPLEAGFYYNPLDERIVIKMIDMTPSYLGNKSDLSTFLGAINPIKFEFTGQNGKNMTIGQNAYLENAFTSNAPKIAPSKKNEYNIDFNDGSWRGYNTPDYPVTPTTNLDLGQKVLRWTAPNPTVSRIGMVKKFNDNDLLEVAVYNKTGSNQLYLFAIDSNNRGVFINVPLNTNVRNKAEYHNIETNALTLTKVSGLDLTLAGKTVDAFKIPVDGSMSLGMMKNGRNLYIYINGVLMDKYTHTSEIKELGFGNSNNDLEKLEFWQPIVYRNSDIESSRKLKVYCLGDSNTFGSRVTMRWADFLPIIARQYQGLGEIEITEVNATVDISSGGVGLPSFVRNDIVVIMLGTNDSRVAGNNITIGETYNTNMTTLIDKVVTDGAIPVICTFGLLFDGADTGSGYFIPYTFKSGYLINRLKRTCIEKNVEVAEVRNYLSSNWDNFYSDALHYTNPAHLEIAKAVSDAISRTLLPQKIDETTRVSFDGTNASIYSDYNVRSVERTAPGRYKINFIRPMRNLNYIVTALMGNETSSIQPSLTIDTDQADAKSLNYVRLASVATGQSTGGIDSKFIDVIIKE